MLQAVKRLEVARHFDAAIFVRMYFLNLRARSESKLRGFDLPALCCPVRRRRDFRWNGNQ
jgi:hypothetical protein